MRTSSVPRGGRIAGNLDTITITSDTVLNEIYFPVQPLEEGI